MRTIVIEKVKGQKFDVHSALNFVSAWLHTCLPGKYTISMKKVPDVRTINQNKFMWVCFNVIARAWTEGYGRTWTKQEVHDFFCMKYFPVDTPKGRVFRSTSSLSTEEMSWFLDNIRAEVAEDGIELPTPESDFFAALAEEYSND